MKGFQFLEISLSFCLFLVVISYPVLGEKAIFFPGEFPPVSNRIYFPPTAPASTPETNGTACSTPEGAQGQCLPLKECPNILDLIKENNGIHAPSTFGFIKKRICKFKDTSAYVCCAPQTHSESSVQPADPLLLPISDPLPSVLPTLQECGLSLRSKVVMGKEFEHGAHPWLVGIGYLDEDEAFKVECGGTLITKRHVLSAAHCFFQNPELAPGLTHTHVIVGEHSISKAVERDSPQILQIVQRKELDYNHTTHYHDISILVLEKDVTFTTFIRPACLPFGLQDEDLDYDKNEPIIAGWGRTFFGERLARDLPQEAGVSFVSKTDCRKAYEFSPEIPLDNTQICFGNDGRDACQGDSGGPLLYLDKEKFKRFFLLGIISFGEECGNPNFPGVYTFIPPYLGWISANLS